MEKRGIVITPQLKEIQGGIKGGPIIKPEIFRQYLVYWDEIVIVNLQNPIIGSFGIEKLPDKNLDVKVAQDAGRFKIANHDVRDKTSYHSSEIAEDFREGQQNIAFFNTQMYDGYWTIGQSIKRLHLHKVKTLKRDVINTKLHKALPVPGNNVSAEQIIEFRERRNDEFEAFRKTYDELYSSIVKEGDQQLALQRAIERLESSLCDVRVVMEEENMNPTQMTFETFWSVSADTMVKIAAASTLLGELNPFSIIIGAANAAISFNKETQDQPNPLPDQVNDYAYLSYVEKELGS